MKRRKGSIKLLLCWAVLNAIALSCNLPTEERQYMQVVSVIPASAGVDQPITVTVSVQGKQVGVATGTVTIDGDTRCSFLLVGGTGSCQVTYNSAGPHNLSINYSGDSNYRTEYKQLPYNVTSPSEPTPTIPTTLMVDPVADGATAVGEAAEFIVMINPLDDIPPSGTVTLTADGETGCTAALSRGEGTCTIQFNTPGFKTVTATYPPTGQWLGDTATITHLVNYPTEITLTFSPNSPTVGQWVQASVVVSVIGGGPTPTGDVSLSVSPTEGCTDFTLVDGRGSCTFSFSRTGERTVEATFWPTNSAGDISEEVFRGSRILPSLTVGAALAPPPAPTQSSGGGAVGCEVYHEESDSWICEAPCPYSPPPPHTCTP